MSVDRTAPRPQLHTSNRPETPFVPLVGESAVRLAHVGLSPMRIEGLPALLHTDGGKLVRARRDRVGRLGEFRALVVEEESSGVVSVAFVPRPSLDLGVFGTEIASTPRGLQATFSIYAGTGTWFAGQHAHRIWQELRRAAPDLITDGGARNARDRQRGFSVEVELERDGIERLADLHRRAWVSYVQSLADALELDHDGAERNARSIEAWKTHRRTGSMISRLLLESGTPEAARIHGDVLAA